MKMEFNVSKGFKKAHSFNIPTVTCEMLFSYMYEVFLGNTKKFKRQHDMPYTVIDYVQLKKKGDKLIIKGIIFSKEENSEDFKNVSCVINQKLNKIDLAGCKECSEESLCVHILEFLFWLHRSSRIMNSSDTYNIFWDIRNQDSEINAILLKDVILTTAPDLYSPKNVEEDVTMITPEHGDNFLQLVLDQMEKMGLTETHLYSHCRSVFDEFEPLYIHHTMLNASNHSITDFKSFIMHMEDVATRGLYFKIAEISSNQYKNKLWMETQYCRIRCSLMYAVLTRQDPSEDDVILDEVFCKNRGERIGERKSLKDHKRFILKQTEKLENKEYKECGLLLNETYPFICASPDGVTDDHIVEIKVPKTDEEFEKYLVGKETIGPKYMAQMQIQMYAANVQRALYCVLNPKFETNGAMHYVWVQAELQQVANLLSAAEDYWKEVIFPEVKKLYITNKIPSRRFSIAEEDEI